MEEPHTEIIIHITRRDELNVDLFCIFFSSLCRLVRVLSLWEHSMAPCRIIRIGLLICGFFQGAVVQAHGDYYDVYSNYLKSTMPPSNCNTKVVIEGFHVRNMEFPNERRFDEFDLFMVTGSRKSFPPG